MFRKRKDITPNAPASKKQSEQETQLTPARPIPVTSDSTQAPKQNRSNPIFSQRDRSQSTFSLNSFKSFPDLSTKTSKRLVNDLDFGATKKGKMRDAIDIDVHFLDGEAYPSNISEIEAHQLILRQALGFDRNLIHDIRFSWRGHPVVHVRLNELIDIDTLPKGFDYKKPDFDKDGKEFFHTVSCEIRGVREPGDQPPPRREPQADDDDLPKNRWIKLEGIGHDVKAPEVKEWLSYFGELLSDMEVETVEFQDAIPMESDRSDTDRTVTLATGNYSIKMRLLKEIPQLLPCYGGKVKVYYRGIDKLCQNCFEIGHEKKSCRKERVLWLAYVNAFRDEFKDIPSTWYGKWSPQADAFKRMQRRQTNTSK